MEVKVMEKVSGNYVENVKGIRKDFPGAVVFDISKEGGMGYLSAESFWGGIDVPGMRGKKGLSVLGVWEGLKVFSKKGVDVNFICDEKKLGAVRNCKSYGNLIGVRYGDDLLEVNDGIEKVFKRIYKKEVSERYGKVIENMKDLVKKRNIVFLEEKEKDRKAPCSVGEILKELIIEKS